MNDPAQLKNLALETVHSILKRRLARVGIPVTRPELYFQCHSTEPRPFPGGLEVRVQTWRHWSDAMVELNTDTGELMAYSIDEYAVPPSDVEMTEEEALAAASAIEIPGDAVLQSFTHFKYTSKCKLARLEWGRMHQGLRVDGDYLWVSIHPKTRRIVEFARKWRTLRL